MTLGDTAGLLVLGGDEAVGARLQEDIARVGLVFRSQRRLAGVALHAVGFVESGVQADSIIEHEALAIIVRRSAFFEVFEDAALQLIDLLEPLHLHKGAGLLAADAARAEHHNRLLLHRCGQLGHGSGELSERIDPGDDGVAERAEFDLVIVASVEQRDGSPLIKPAPEFLGCQLGRRLADGVDPLDPEADDLLFDLHQHAAKRLVRTLADLNWQGFQSGDHSQLSEELIDFLAPARDEKIDPFGTEQNCPAQAPLLAASGQLLAQNKIVFLTVADLRGERDMF